MKILSILIFFSFPSLLWADSDSLVGKFRGVSSTEQKAEKRFIEVIITEKDSRYFLSGSGGFSTGRSAAPDFSGSGFPTKVPPMKFLFEDSFGNKGTAFVTPGKMGISFSVTISEVKDSRCLPLYEEIKLSRKKS
jgi:hypothetical protein